MPIKVRCSKCRKVLTAPDKARGKAIRCPGCSTPVRVPAERQSDEAIEAGEAGEAGEAPVAADPADDESFFAALDLSQAEDQHIRLCPRCASEVSVNAKECPYCHVNLDTGIVSARMMKRLQRKGPDPGLFFGAAWKDSWRFMWANQRLALQTVMVYAIVNVLMIVMTFVSFWMITNFLPGMTQEQKQQQAQQQQINEDDDKNVSKPIRPLSQLLHEDGFMILNGLYVLLHMVILGWLWHMQVEIVRTTMARKNVANRVSFGFIDSAAVGVKAYLWPAVFAMPILLIGLPLALLQAVGISGFSDRDAIIDALLKPGPVILAVVGVVALLLAVCLPTAMIHHAQKHTYRAWSLPLILVSAGRNILATLYLGLIALTTMLLPLAVIGAGMGIARFALKIPFNTPQWLIASELIEFSGLEGGAVSTLVFPWKAVGTFAGTVMIATLAGSFAMLFLMRSIGLYAYYFQRRLDLVPRTHPGQLAGFWARYIAYFADMLIIATIGVIFEPIELWKLNEKGKLAAMGFAGLVVFLFTRFGFTFLAFGLSYLLMLPLVAFVYFARSESSKEQATLGKEAVALMVTGMNGERLTFAQACKRTFLKMVLFPAAIMAAFTPKKQAAHDIIAQTLVVFHGDVDREE